MKTSAYRLGGLRIVSDIPLYGLQICRGDVVACGQVTVRHASIPQKFASTLAMFRDGQLIGKYNGKEVLIDIPRAGRFLVRAGNEILIDPTPSSEESEVRAYLLGTVFGLLCHQRGIMPFHASAIDVADGCVAFVGDSGAGKSTLVAALSRRGYQVIADDVCFQQFDEKGSVHSWPGIGHIRLWEEAMHALGCGGEGVVRELRRYNKYYIPVNPPQNPARCRHLHRVYQLCSASDGASEITRLHGAVAVEALLQNVYRLELAERLGYKPNAFMVCAAVARDIPVFRFSRPFDFDTLDKSLDCLESHLKVGW